MAIAKDFLARRLISPMPLTRKMRTAMGRNEARLLMRGNIHAILDCPAEDGTDLHGWYIRAKSKPRGLAICLHGMWDSCAGFYWMARRLTRRGFDVLLPDMRAHGLSGGEFITWGAREVDDAIRLKAQAHEYGATTEGTFVVGFSYGGGVAVQLAAELPDCLGTVALAPVGSARRIMHYLLKFWGATLTDIQAEEVVGRASEIGGFDIDSASAIDAAHELRCPIAMAHGKWDSTVPFTHGRDIAAAAGDNLTAFHTPRRGHNSLLWRRSAWVARHLRAMGN